MTTQELIVDAIRNKQQVLATYDGYDREMCPHVLGYKGGTLQALFYQFGGFSSSGAISPGSPGNWRCMVLSKLSDVRVQDGPWHTAPNHTRPQTCVDTVIAEVEF